MRKSIEFFKPTSLHVVLLLYWTLTVLYVRVHSAEELEATDPPRLSEFLRNLSRTRISKSPVEFEVTTWRPKTIRSIAEEDLLEKQLELSNNNSSSTKVGQLRGNGRGRARLRTNRRRNKPELSEVGEKVAGIDRDSRRKPEELIRTALINHTLEHGGEEDLDKLVFSTLPQGSKLILRTVRIIKTDENGDPMDESEHQQPTYWDVTLANATDKIVDDEEEDAETGSSEEGGEDGGELTPSEAASRIQDGTGVGRRRVAGRNGTTRGRKKSDLESSESHAAQQYHHGNEYGAKGREKEHGKTHYHGNTHGKTHKQTHTVTDGKDVKPYQGSESGIKDHADSHASDNKNQGERYKSSKRKNKGRKVTGFKRVYHKEEFQRTEHFYDDEEARKIAESFGLAEAKESSDKGSKGGKKKYHGVVTEYLDGKKHENEHATKNGYNKGQQDTYKDTEKHSHHNNYGKSMAQSHHGGGGNSPQYHHRDDHNHNQHHNDGSYHHQEQPQHHGHHDTQQLHPHYHPNHNYHASHSNPRKNTFVRLPTSISDQLGRGRGVSGVIERPNYASAAIIAAPIATSFTVSEISPSSTDESASTPDPTVIDVLEHAMKRYPPDKLAYGGVSQQQGNPGDEDEDGYENYEREGGGRRHKNKARKEPHEKKVFFSPKHRVVQEDHDWSSQVKNGKHLKNFQSVPVNAVPYQVNLSPEVGVSPAEDDGKEVSPSPYAPNFGPKQLEKYLPYDNYEQQQPGLLTKDMLDHYKQKRYPKSWRWPRRRQKRPRAGSPTLAAPVQEPSDYPLLNQVHLAAIPLRHANAYQRLRNRLRYRFQQRPHYMELTTRKSDEGVEDIGPVENLHRSNSNGTQKGKENDSAHYFNHNHRYAKHHLTSTVNPTPETATVTNGVRNTLLGNYPGYSTIVKVLPVTMLNMNGSSHSGASRPRSATDHISITTPAPVAIPSMVPVPHFAVAGSGLQQHHPHHHQHQHQPAQNPYQTPGNPWLTVNLNYGKPRTDFHIHPHPFNDNSKRPPNTFMVGIKNNPRPYNQLFPVPPPNALLASPSATSGPQVIQFQRLPSNRPRYLPMLRRPLFQRPYRRPPMMYNPNIHPYPGGGIMPLGSKDFMNAVSPPTSFSSTTVFDTKPKFYYAFNASSLGDLKMENGQQVAADQPKTDNESDRVVEFNLQPKPTLKVANLVSVSTTVSPATVTTATAAPSKKSTTQAPPVINGLMDSVSEFFGRMG